MNGILQVCVDCVLALANDDYSAIEARSSPAAHALPSDPLHPIGFRPGIPGPNRNRSKTRSEFAPMLDTEDVLLPK